MKHNFNVTILSTYIWSEGYISNESVSRTRFPCLLMPMSSIKSEEYTVCCA